MHLNLRNSSSSGRIYMATLMSLLIFGFACNKNNMDKTIVILDNSESEYPVKLSMVDTSGIKAVDSIMHFNDKSQLLADPKETRLFLIEGASGRIEFLASKGDTVIIDFKAKKAINKTNNENQKYSQLISIFDKANQQADSLSYLYLSAQTTDSFPQVRIRVSEKFDMLIEQARDDVKAYIQANPASLSIFRAVNGYIKQTPVFSYSVDYEWYRLADSLLTLHNADHPYTIFFHDKVSALEKNRVNEVKGSGLKQGEFIPDFTLTGLNEKPKKLEISKTGVTLIYLWDHSEKSRRFNQHVKQLHERYKENDFNVKGICIDDNFKRWASVIEIDKMWWDNLIDTGGENSNIVKQLNNPPMPYFILAGGDRKVLNSFYDPQQVESWLKEYYKNKNS